MLKNGEPKKHVRGSKKRVEVKKTAGEVKKTVGHFQFVELGRSSVFDAAASRHGSCVGRCIAKHFS